jgi:hypothetical protein
VPRVVSRRPRHYFCEQGDARSRVALRVVRQRVVIVARIGIELSTMRIRQRLQSDVVGSVTETLFGVRTWV